MSLKQPSAEGPEVEGVKFSHPRRRMITLCGFRRLDSDGCQESSTITDM